jgi:hypothetical protein
MLRKKKRKGKVKSFFTKSTSTIIMAVTEGLVREEQLLHDMCLLGAMTMEITQILTRAGKETLFLTRVYLNPS